MESVKIEEYEISETLKKACADALFVQSACNLSGVVFAFARIMQLICNESNRLHKGTDWKNQHPIVRLFAEQIQFLSAPMEYSKAFDFCDRGSK